MSNFSDLKKRNLLSMELMSKTMGGRMAAVAEWDPRGDGTCGYKSSYGTVECGDALLAYFLAAEHMHWCSGALQALVVARACHNHRV